MTKQSEIINDPKFIPVLDHGFVGLVDTMGTDASIVQAARVSYGDGTKTVLEDRGLIRYLMRHKHTSPFEMCQIKLHIKTPIFVMRQWVRHRTASLNEYSGRYSVMTDEFYLPEPEAIQPQSSNNKQGRAGEMSDTNTTGVRWMMDAAYKHSYDIYNVLLGEYEEKNKRDLIYDPFAPDDEMFDQDYNGIAREMARSVLPVGNYTELYWTQNLHNMMHLLKLRLDSHAQYEIRVFAQAVYDLIQPIFPEALAAFDDYVREATSNSRMETNLIKSLMSASEAPRVTFSKALLRLGSDKNFAEQAGLSLRELRDFTKQWDLPSFEDAELFLKFYEEPVAPAIKNTKTKSSAKRIPAKRTAAKKT